jgi:flagellar motor switch protein FliM
MLSRQVQSAEVELVSILGEAHLTFDKILKMQIGDIIPLEVGDTITTMVDNVPVMECKYGVFNNQYALKVEKLLASSSDSMSGE